MHDDDEILEAHEFEFDDPMRGAPARSNRGFWLVTGSLLLACVLMLLAIFVNRPIGNVIGRSQHALRLAQQGAQRVYAETGSFQGADATSLTQARYDGGELTYLDADTASTSTGSVSVAASASTWAAAVQIKPGACFYLKLNAGATDPLYGVGTECTGTQALNSKDGQW